MADKRQRAPPEVWLTIFEFATHVPNALDIHAADPFTYPGPLTQEEIQKGLRESMNIKRSLVLVCKSWNTLATRFLYQALAVLRVKALTLLLRSLTSGSSSVAANAVHTRGSWTRRLDISFSVGRSGAIDDLSRLLRCLPNLQIIILRRNFPSIDPSTEIACLFDALTSRTTRTLHVLSMSCKGRFHSEEVYKMLESIKVQPLHVLSIRSQLSLQKEVEMEVPHIESLDVPGQLLLPVLASEAPLPLLSCLSLEISHFPKENIISGSLSRVGHTLKTLEIDDDLWSSTGSAGFETVMFSVAESCPNLSRIIISLKNLRHPMLTTYLPPVEKLGLRLQFTMEIVMEWWNSLCETLERLVIATPTVRTVRIISRPPFRDVSQSHWQILNIFRQSSLTLLSQHDVRFEDCSGRLLHES